MSARRRALAAAALALAAGAPAEAHLVTTGLGPVYDGIAHFLESPDDWAPVLALAFLAGLSGPVASRRALAALPVAWLAGGIAGTHLFSARTDGGFGLVAAVSLLSTGTLLAWGRSLRGREIAILAALVGIVHGTMNGLSFATARGRGVELAGIAATVFVLVALGAALVLAARRRWPASAVAVRVAGSWIAAIGLLLLGWQLRAPR